MLLWDIFGNKLSVCGFHHAVIQLFIVLLHAWAVPLIAVCKLIYFLCRFLSYTVIALNVSYHTVCHKPDSECVRDRLVSKFKNVCSTFSKTNNLIIKFGPT